MAAPTNHGTLAPLQKGLFILRRTPMAHEPYQNAVFIKSASLLSQLPPDEGIEVAFAGRSNAGKSTLLNLVTHQKGLAKTSKTPGRTQLINTFEFAPQKRLIDLPGYGFAKVPQSVKANWQKTLSLYLQKRDSLRGLVVLMDSRHPMKDLDCQLIEWACESELDIHCVLTKSDKLSYSEKLNILRAVQKEIPFTNIEVQTISAMDKSGLDILEKKLDFWFSTPLPADQSSDQSPDQSLAQPHHDEELPPLD